LIPPVRELPRAAGSDKQIGQKIAMKNDKAVRIGLLWHSVQSSNLGVGALTVSNIALLREACAELGLRPRFLVLGPRTSGSIQVEAEDVEAVDIDLRFLRSPSGYWARLKSLDCLIDIGGGDSFAEIYGFKRFSYVWLTKYIALLGDRPLLLSPQTIGPFERQPYRAMARYVMSRAEVVLARDPMSYELAGELAGRTRLRQSIDVAFALPYERRARADRSHVEVGVNVSGLLFNGGFSGTNSFGLDVDYADLMRRYIAALIARDDVRVKLITHVVTRAIPAEDDGEVADRLAAEFPQVERVADFATPGDAKSYISGLDLLVGGRMHACIAAYSSGVPTIPIAYSRKFSGLFEGVLGYGHGVPVKGWSTDQALDYLNAAVDRRAELKAEIEAGLTLVEEKLDIYRNELKPFLRDAVEREAA
jgi:colanic acid/amylovoran biosynthesis protein